MIKPVRLFALLAVALLVPFSASAKLVEYVVNIEYKTMNVTGKTVQMIALGKEGTEPTVPAPTLEFTEGDTLKVTFNNKLKEETSIHWHGILLPNDQDGVPYVTTPPILAGKSHTFEFPIKQSGTYWYHSHTGLQEQKGVYGAIVIHPLKETIKYDREAVIVLSDWTDRNPEQILRNLKTDAEWEQIQKNTLRSWSDDVKGKTVGARLKSEWTRMGPMDVADVAYDAFLANGKQSQVFDSYKPGEKVRLRIINSAASSYFHLGFGKQKMTVVSADGLNVNPVPVDEILIGIAETYDVIVEIPKDKSVEFRATSQDITGYTSTFFGSGEKELARDIPKPNPYGHDHGGHGGMNMNEGENIVRLSYEMLESPVDTSLPSGAETVEYEIQLRGDMRRYVWTFNNKILAESDFFMIKKGQNVRFKLVNNTMMHHPIHLHGHFFRVPTLSDEFSPLKHTIDIKPMETRVIEFYASEEKDWLFHCHNLYHMEAGMTQIVRYMDMSNMKPGHNMGSMPNMGGMAGNKWYNSAQGTFGTNFSEVQTQFSNHKYDVNLKGECEYQKDKECEGRLESRRVITPYFSVYGAVNGDPKGPSGSAGVRYILPMLIEARLGAGTRGLEFSAAKSFPITRKLNLRGEVGREAGKIRYKGSVEYRKSRRIGVEASYSEKGVGVGINVRK